MRRSRCAGGASARDQRQSPDPSKGRLARVKLASNSASTTRTPLNGAPARDDPGVWSPAMPSPYGSWAPCDGCIVDEGLQLCGPPLAADPLETNCCHSCLQNSTAQTRQLVTCFAVHSGMLCSDHSEGLSALKVGNVHSDASPAGERFQHGVTNS